LGLHPLIPLRQIATVAAADQGDALSTPWPI